VYVFLTVVATSANMVSDAISLTLKNGTD